MNHASLDVELGADGSLQGWQIVGFHGVVGESQTPARGEPVYVDARHRLARIMASVGQRRWIGEVAAELLGPGPLPGQGTRIGPWPARLGDVVVVLGPRETLRAIELLRRAQNPETPKAVRTLLHWLADSSDGSTDPVQRCERRGDFLYWVTSDDNAWTLFDLIGSLISEELKQAMQRGDGEALAQMGWWMSRTAHREQDFLMAIAALRSGGESDWLAFVQDLFPDRPINELKEEVGRIEQRLQTPSPPLS